MNLTLVMFEFGFQKNEIGKKLKMETHFLPLSTAPAYSTPFGTVRTLLTPHSAFASGGPSRSPSLVLAQVTASA